MCYTLLLLRPFHCPIRSRTWFLSRSNHFCSLIDRRLEVGIHGLADFPRAVTTILEIPLEVRGLRLKWYIQVNRILKDKKMLLLILHMLMLKVLELMLKMKNLLSLRWRQFMVRRLKKRQYNNRMKMTGKRWMILTLPLMNHRFQGLRRRREWPKILRRTSLGLLG